MTSPLITDINIGDIYISKKDVNCPRLIGMSGNGKPFQFLGFLGLKAFAPKNDKLESHANWTKQEAIDNLNQNDFYLAGNINEKVEKSLDLAKTQMFKKWKEEELAVKKAKENPPKVKDDDEKVLKILKLDIPDGYKLLGLNDIVTNKSKYKFAHSEIWYPVVNSVGNKVEWGKDEFGDDIEYIAPIND